MYVGQQLKGHFKVSNSPKDIAQRLVVPVSDSNRNITCNNWYISFEPFGNATNLQQLAPRKNKREIAFAFLNVKNREIGSTLFEFLEDYSILWYVSKKGKILTSSYHHDGTQKKLMTGNIQKS